MPDLNEIFERHKQAQEDERAREFDRSAERQADWRQEFRQAFEQSKKCAMCSKVLCFCGVEGVCL